jgi:hypothetical protein
MKMRRLLRSSAAWALVLLSVLILLEVQTVDAADDVLPPLPPGILAIHLEGYKATYRVNETIGIRISIRNNTPEDYLSANLPVWVLCEVTVLNDRNESLQSGGLRGPGYRGGGAGMLYRAGRSEFVGPGGSWPLVDDWVPLAYWGYELGEPGTYRVTAVAKFTTWAATPDATRFTFSEHSNSIKVKIVE